MKIKLITQEEYEWLLEVQENFPALTYQNTGYDTIKEKDLTPKDKEIIKELEVFLGNHIVGFSSFQNFRHGKSSGKLQLRFQYNWEEGSNNRSFIGVGYIDVIELLNGFKTE